MPIPTNAAQREGAWRQGFLHRRRDRVPAAYHAYICTMRDELNRRDVLIGAAATVLPAAAYAEQVPRPRGDDQIALDAPPRGGLCKSTLTRWWTMGHCENAA